MAEGEGSIASAALLFAKKKGVRKGKGSRETPESGPTGGPWGKETLLTPVQEEERKKKDREKRSQWIGKQYTESKKKKRKLFNSGGEGKGGEEKTEKRELETLFGKGGENTCKGPFQKPSKSWQKMQKRTLTWEKANHRKKTAPSNPFA